MGEKGMDATSRVVKQFRIEIPWPPSANTYWRRHGDKYFISTKGKEFRQIVLSSCYKDKSRFDELDRLKVYIEAYPPDRRKRDLDNIFKATLDAFQWSGIFPDDSQIDDLHIIRKEVGRGVLEVMISTI